MSESLEDVISGTEPEPVEAKEPEATEVKAEKVEAKPEEPKAEPKSESSSDDVNKALLAELTRIRKQNQELKAEKEPPKEPTNIWEDPEKRLGELAEEFDNKLARTRNTISENYARKAYPDYDEKLDVFLEMVQENPVLVDQMNAAQDPATFAYESAKQKMLLQKIGNLSDYEQEIMKKAEKAAEEKFAKMYAEKMGQELPTSLADNRAAADNTSFVEPTLMDVIGTDNRSR